MLKLIDKIKNWFFVTFRYHYLVVQSRELSESLRNHFSTDAIRIKMYRTKKSGFFLQMFKNKKLIYGGMFLTSNFEIIKNTLVAQYWNHENDRRK